MNTSLDLRWALALVVASGCNSTVSETLDPAWDPTAEEQPAGIPDPDPVSAGGAPVGEDGASPTEPSAPTGSDPALDLFDCVLGAAQPSSQSLMLTKAQLENTIEDLFGSAALDAAATELSVLPEEAFDATSHVRLSTISEEKVEAYYRIGHAVAGFVTEDDGRTSSVFGACATQASPGANCLDGFLDGFARRVLRRPLTHSEKSFARGLVSDGSGSHREQLRAVLAYLLTSPHFTWRIEVGERVNGQLRLTSHEVATRLSYTFTNSTPDLALHQRAEASELGSLAVVRDEARRLLSTPRGRSKLTAGIARWSLMDRTADLSNLPQEMLRGANADALSRAMIEEALVFIENMVFEQNATFEDLLTSPLSFAADPTLADLYGHSPATLDSPAEFEGRRRGLLLRAPALTATGPRAHIINRGVDVQKRILCNQIPLPTVDISDSRDSSDLTEAERLEMSNREIVSMTTAPAVCQGCHSTIDPTGYVFESFDSLGRLRDAEQIFTMEGELHGEVSIDPAADVPLPLGGTIPMNDAYDFVGWVAESDVGKACFARNMLRFLTERTETPNDECNLQAASDVLLGSSTPVSDLVIEALINDDFLTKTVEQ